MKPMTKTQLLNWMKNSNLTVIRERYSTIDGVTEKYTILPRNTDATLTVLNAFRAHSAVLWTPGRSNKISWSPSGEYADGTPERKTELELMRSRTESIFNHLGTGAN